MTASSLTSRVLFALLILPAVGCTHVPGLMATAEVKAHDYSDVDAFATHKPKRTPKRTSSEGSNLDKMLANAATEAKAPGAFALSADSADFRQAEAGQADSQRKQLASQIGNNSDIMDAFQNWDGQSSSDRLKVLKAIATIEGKVMSFNVPPMKTKTGAPSDGTMAYFAGATDGLGSVTLFPDAISKGDKWSAIATVTHEMRHAYQFQLVNLAAKKKIKQGSTDETLAYGFYQADAFINKAGGEDNMAYGDYCHLNNEFDAFATGNMVAAIVSNGDADTTGLGFVDVQYNARGTAQVSLISLEKKAGANGLLDAINKAETKVLGSSN